MATCAQATAKGGAVGARRCCLRLPHRSRTYCTLPLGTSLSPSLASHSAALRAGLVGQALLPASAPSVTYSLCAPKPLEKAAVNN